MLTLEEMLLRLGIALILGFIIGFERELIGKEAGVRTCMMVSSGASIFAMIALSLPYIVSVSFDNIADVVARNSGFLAVIANIVVGVGFLGAGIIIKTEERVRGITTAALIWVVAAIGTLVGIGLLKFAAISAVLISTLLYLLRNLNISQKVSQIKNDQN
jgi:putative Mg2+ transporter-C (MgtC) family protein